MIWDVFLQSLLNKHTDMKPHVESILKCSKEIHKILGEQCFSIFIILITMF